MGKLGVFQRIRNFFGFLCWRGFIWAREMTEEEYWDLIYWQEKDFKEQDA